MKKKRKNRNRRRRTRTKKKKNSRRRTSNDGAFLIALAYFFARINEGLDGFRRKQPYKHDLNCEDMGLLMFFYYLFSPGFNFVPQSVVC